VKKICGAIMGFLGGGALNLSADGFSFSTGDLLILCASLCTVAANVISKKVFAKVEPITATGVSQLFGGVILLLVGTLMGGKISLSGATAIPVLLYIGVASVISYCIWYGAVKRGELSQLFIIKFSEPIFACIIGAVILREDILKWQYLAAFLLICGGIVVSNLTFNKKTKQEKNAASS
jgi:drug/metabolite transporter (DMT)-like permease